MRPFKKSFWLIDKLSGSGYNVNMDDKERLRELLLELAHSINDAISDNRQVKDVLMNFEKEGYHVDLILASITKVARKDEEELKYEFSPFDMAFLNAIKIRLE